MGTLMSRQHVSCVYNAFHAATVYENISVVCILCHARKDMKMMGWALLAYSGTAKQRLATLSNPLDVGPNHSYTDPYMSVSILY